MSNEKIFINMLSIKEKLYISVESVHMIVDKLIDMFQGMEQNAEITEEFIVGSISGLEFFKERIHENEDKFKVEIGLSELGLSNEIKKIELKIKNNDAI